MPTRLFPTLRKFDLERKVFIPMHPKSYLFVPGNRPERFAKACASGADAVILDLEDAVSPAAKGLARDAVCSWLTSGQSAYVRINAEGTEWFDADVAALVNLPGVLGIVVPKAENALSIATLSARLSEHCVLLPLLESALGFDNLRAIAHAPKVQRLIFGTLDFQVDTGIRGDGEELLYFRSQLTLVSRVAGIAAPVDGVTASIDDSTLIRTETMRARNLGFRAKLCIHPKQVASVHQAFLPRADEIDWAKKVLAAVKISDGSATIVDGKMVDVPIILKAKEILTLAHGGDLAGGAAL